MELVNVDPATNAVKLFEYNSFPIEQVQNVWFTAWVEHSKSEFDILVSRFGQQLSSIKLLADLFKESYEVSL